MADKVFHAETVIDPFATRYDRYYLQGQEIAHLAHYGGGKFWLCGGDILPNDNLMDADLYLGTGDQHEWDYARRLPICPKCLELAIR